MYFATMWGSEEYTDNAVAKEARWRLGEAVRGTWGKKAAVAVEEVKAKMKPRQRRTFLVNYCDFYVTRFWETKVEEILVFYYDQLEHDFDVSPGEVFNVRVDETRPGAFFKVLATHNVLK